ncbi:MAG TPA: hypothetical protein VM537_19755 [Anaerolineae bacterium]|nr:hypothetical protein [Anaerolineae bacterium]
MDTLRILLGAIVLILGRKLYWLFVAVAGFVLGMALAPRFISGGSQWVILVIALAAGLLGALLAVFLQQAAIAVAGFIGGGYAGFILAGMAGWDAGRLVWVPIIIGGILGVVLVVALFEWALIILSSLTGAGLIVEATQLSTATTGLLFVALLVVGIAVQAGLMRGERHRSEPGPPAQSDA